MCLGGCLLVFVGDCESSRNDTEANFRSRHAGFELNIMGFLFSTKSVGNVLN